LLCWSVSCCWIRYKLRACNSFYHLSILPHSDLFIHVFKVYFNILPLIFILLISQHSRFVRKLLNCWILFIKCFTVVSIIVNFKKSSVLGLLYSPMKEVLTKIGIWTYYLKWDQFYNPGFTLSELILIIADQILNDSLCCSYKYNWCLCRFIGKLYILLLTFLIYLSVICIFLPETIWIKLKPD